jgi:hypothetical protein
VFGFKTLLLEPLRPELERLSVDVQSDPGIAEAEARWSRCVSSAGHSISDHAHLQQVIERKVHEPFEKLLETPDAVKLRELQSLEIGLAQAVFACDVAWTQDLQSIRKPYADRVVASHSVELGQLRDAILIHYEELARQYGVTPNAVVSGRD